MKNVNKIFILSCIALAITITGCKTDVPEPRPQEEILLEDAVKAISVPKEIKADTNTISLQKELKEEKFKDLSIEWISSNPQVIDVTNGKVNHGDKEESDKVTLTLKLSINNYKVTKEYVVLIKNQYKPNTKLLLDAIKTISIPKVINVDTNTITLPSSFEDPKFENITVKWHTDKPTVINIQGNVNHKDKTESDIVTLTVTLTSNNESKTAKYEVEVKNEISEEKLLLEEALETVSIPLVINEDDLSINLIKKIPQEKYQNIKVQWIMSDEDIISNTGIVTHSDTNESNSVTVTVILSLSEKIVSKDFNVTVKNRKFSGDQKDLNQLVEKFTLPYTVLDNTTTSIELPSTIPNSLVTIEWESTNEEIINSKTKVVTHPDSLEDTNVTLTAFFTYYNAKATKKFILTVEPSPSNNTIIEEARITVQNNLSKNISETTSEIVLPTKCNNLLIPEFSNVVVSWESTNTNIITYNPKTTFWDIIHTPKADPQKVTLKMTITYNGESQTFDYIVTVQNPTETEEEKQDKEDRNTINEVLTQLDIPNSIKEHETEINLPSSIKHNNETITITWESSDENIISKEGKVTHTPGRETDTITLKATLQLNRVTEYKTYTVTVTHPEETLKSSEIINTAKEYLPPIEFTDLSLKKEEKTLPTTQVVDNKNVSITWELITPDNHFSLTENKLVLTRDLGEVKGIIRANLSYDNNIGTKDIEVTIPPITELHEDTGINHLILLQNNILELGYQVDKYRYQMTNLNMEKHQMTLQLIQILQNNNWIDIEALKKDKIDLLDQLLENSKTLDSASIFTVDNILPVFESFWKIWGEPEVTVNEDLIYEYAVSQKCFGDNVNDVEIAKGLSDEQKDKGFRQFYKNFLDEIRDMAKVDNTVTLENTILILKQDYINAEPIINFSYILPIDGNI